MKHRHEIDGLRALAILPVIIFHSGLNILKGGFIGVDIFFVISGYLIANIIKANLENQSFSIIDFYERRARRILPALFFMLLISLPFAYLWMNPHDLQKFSKNLFGAILFVSNIVSYKQSNYFDADSITKPLLHLWSLAIEEQFYIFFPILLFGLWPKSKNKILWVLVLIFIISLYVSEMTLMNNKPGAFFLLSSRAWELMLGAIASFWMVKQNMCLKKEIYSWIGFFLIIYALVFFNANSDFPGLLALIPTAGAALILIFGDKNTTIGKLLSKPYIVNIGLISYSGYLWHQPVFAFFYYRHENSPNIFTIFILIALIFILAYLSWRFVETPFRNKKNFSRRTIFISAGIASLIFISLAFFCHSTKGFSNRFPKTLSNAFYPTGPHEHQLCNFKKIPNKKIDICEFGDVNGKLKTILYGDSHASAFLDSLDIAFKKNHIKGFRVQLRDRCHVIPGLINNMDKHVDIKQENICLSEFNDFVQFSKDQADAIIVSIYWTPKIWPFEKKQNYFFDNGEGGISAGGLESSKSNFVFTKNGVMSDLNDISKKNAILFLLDSLAELNKKLIVIYPIPETGWDIPRYNFKSYINEGKVKEVITTDYKKYIERNEFIINILDEYKSKYRVNKIKSGEILCNRKIASRCLAQIESKPLYIDNNHLSSFGGEFISNEIIKNL